MDCPTWDGVLLAGAAVFAAAWTANRRMGRQLDSSLSGSIGSSSTTGDA